MLGFHLLPQDSCSSFLTVPAYIEHLKKALNHFGLSLSKALSSMQTIPRLQQGDSTLKNNKAVCELSILYLTSIKDFATCIIQLNMVS